MLDIAGRFYFKPEAGKVMVSPVDMARSEPCDAQADEMEVAIAIDRIETNPRFATITRPANAAILIGLRLDMDGRGGLLQIAFPYATIEPIRELLMQSFMGEKLGRDTAKLALAKLMQPLPKGKQRPAR